MHYWHFVSTQSQKGAKLTRLYKATKGYLVQYINYWQEWSSELATFAHIKTIFLNVNEFGIQKQNKLSKFSASNTFLGFFTKSHDKTLQTPPPVLSFSCVYYFAQSPHENNVPGADTRSVLARFCDNNWEKGKDFVTTCRVKKSAWEMEASLCAHLDGVFWIWVKVRSCCEKYIKIKLC